MNGDRLPAGQIDTESLASQDAPAGKIARMKFRFKRMLFVGSLYFGVVGNNRPDEQELDTVNHRFDLASSPQALLFPAAVAVLLWKGFDLTHVLEQYSRDQITLQQLTRELITAAPTWLQYGDKTAIARDVKAVFDCLCAA